MNKFECRQKWGRDFKVPENHILIGNASALTSQKGHETLLRAVAELRKKTKQFSVLIAGDGNLKESLQAMTSDLGISDQVQFVGFIKNVPEFLSALDILAVPSNNEGLGTIILDGILAGCAVVGSNVGGIPEIIIDKKTGLLQEVGDFQKLSQNLWDLIHNPEQTEYLKRAAMEWVKNEFGLAAMVDGNYQIYRSLSTKE